MILKTFEQVPLTVVKLGGSLFSLEHLGQKLVDFCHSQHLTNIAIIPGGGPFADSVRQLDRVQKLSTEISHHLGVCSMSLSARFVATLNEKFVRVESAWELTAAWENSQIPVLDIAKDILDCPNLPASWDVTSDSIAAWVASHHAGSQLILLKSTDLSERTCTFQSAAEAGIVDRFFPFASRWVNEIVWVNFRSSEPQMTRWK